MNPLQFSPGAAQFFEAFHITCMTLLVKKSMKEAALDPLCHDPQCLCPEPK
jgi:hypothetical protein